MPLQKLWRRLFHPEVEFQVLKSHSAVELTCYSTVPSTASVPLITHRRKQPPQAYHKPKKNLRGLRSSSVGRDNLEQGAKYGRPKQLNPIPRYYSHYESFGCSPPLAQIGIFGDDLTMIENRHASNAIQRAATFVSFTPPPATQEHKACVVFCFIETNKASTGFPLASKSMGPDELAAALLAEDEKPSGPSLDENLRVALALCQRYSRHDGFKEGILMKTVESDCAHSYIAYASFLAPDGQSPVDLARLLSRFNRKSAQDMKYRQQQGAYEELYSIVRKPEPFESRIPNNQNGGYIVIGYKLLTLDNSERLESSWMQWSGAGDIARCAPKQWRLKRITFHRQIFTLHDSEGRSAPAPDGFMYVLLCEFENLMEPSHVVMGCDLVERLRVRNCGHVGIYKVQWIYTSPASSRDDTTAQSRVGQEVSRLQTEGDRTEDCADYCSCAQEDDTPQEELLLKLSPIESEGSAGLC